MLVFLKMCLFSLFIIHSVVPNLVMMSYAGGMSIDGDMVNCLKIENSLTPVIRIENRRVCMALADESREQVLRNPWFDALVDSGANMGVTYDVYDAIPGTIKKRVVISLAGVGKKMTSSESCDIQVISNDGKPFVFQNMLIVPEASSKLVSVGMLDLAGWRLKLGGGVCKILDKKRILFSAPLKNGLYQLASPLAKEIINNDTIGVMVPPEILCRRQVPGKKSIVNLARAYVGELSQYELIHQRLAHINGKEIKKAYPKLKIPLGKESPCLACIRGKIHSFPFKSRRRELRFLPGEKFHFDLAGPFLPSIKKRKI